LKIIREAKNKHLGSNFDDFLEEEGNQFLWLLTATLQLHYFIPAEYQLLSNTIEFPILF